MGNPIKLPEAKDFPNIFNGEWSVYNEELPSWRLLREFLFPEMTFFDIGCQKGIYSKAVMDLLYGNCKVHAFDVVRFEEIDQIKNEYPNLSFWHSAIGIQNKPANCKIHWDKKLYFWVDKCMSIDLFVNEQNIDSIDFVKIDVDGLELDVIEGAKESLKKFSPILMIEVESDLDKIIFEMGLLNYEIFETRNDINRFFRKK